MITTSVREALKITAWSGRSVSIIKKAAWAAYEANPNYEEDLPLTKEQIEDIDRGGGLYYPFSLRRFVGAPPPGRVAITSIPLVLLQRKFDEFVNQRQEPLCKIRLHGDSYGRSTFTIFFADPIKGLVPVETKEITDLELDFPGPFNPDFYFSDLNSSGASLAVTEAGIAIRLEFETGGDEIRINNVQDVDLTGFTLNVLLRLVPDSQNGLVGVAVHEDDVVPDVSVDVAGYFDGSASRQIEGKVKSAVSDAVMGNVSKCRRNIQDPCINEVVTRWVTGCSYNVIDVVNDGTTLTVRYVVPLAMIDPFIETPQAPLDRGLLENIDYIVIVMMENRSFDHMLGYLSKHGGRTDVDGLRGGEKNRFRGVDYPSFALDGTLFAESPCHHYDCVVTQVNDGKLDGFVADFAKRFEKEGVSPGKVMGYYTAHHVPVFDALAREFLICQRWFSSHPGPTLPNRFYTLTGRLNRDTFGRWELDNPDMSGFCPVSAKTIFDHLTDQGVSWNYFEHGYSTIRLFDRYIFDDEHVLDARDPTEGFFARAREGTLPSVSFVDPDFITIPPGNDDHPPADIAAGQHFLGEVVRALMDGRGWDKTLLVITYDEHGGFFDHVPPPAGPAVSGVDRYGVRVPTFVVSPWVDRGRTSDVVFDHTSILKTILRRFLGSRPPDLGERVAAANDLSMVLRSSARSDRPGVPDVPRPAPMDARVLSRELEEADERDFHALLRSVRTRFPQPMLPR